MPDTIFDQRDLEQIRGRGMSPEDVHEQIQAFREGFPFARLERPCTPDDGIVVLGPDEAEHLARRYERVERNGRAMKFVPASGAATRMFKTLLSVRNRFGEARADEVEAEAQKGDRECSEFMEFARGIRSFAFWDQLCSVMREGGVDAEEEIARGRYDRILDYLLTEKGLGAADLPKGLIPFHPYPEGPRTPVEEHLVEAARYVRSAEGTARLHFTFSPGWEDRFWRHLEDVRPRYERDGTRFEVEVSAQKPSTDTIAVDMENRPFRNDDGSLLFRPGGHGALLENLDALDGDIVFIKNIDNVVPDRLKGRTVTYKKALGGYLVKLQEELFRHLEALEAGDPDDAALERIWAFATKTLDLSPPQGQDEWSREGRIAFLRSRLNRPLRVCGMVRNQGEPGGGPFWVGDAGGGVSKQIVEASQVDMDDPGQVGIWRSSTHFNPVDLVCGLRDFRGRPFDLKDFRDPATGFISTKSKGGRELKALELPGLWNGSMAYWNTVFVEVPIETFNPVKTVLDLLRREHQPG